MRNSLFSLKPILAAILLMALLLSLSACFQVVEPGRLNPDPLESSATAPKTVTVTVTSPPAVSTPPSTAVSPVVSQKPGIVGIWNFDGNVLDNSGLNNNGRIIGGATLVDGASGFNKALRSGINSHGALISRSPSLDMSKNLALEAWVKLDSLSERSNLVVKSTPPNTQKSYILQITAEGRVALQVWKNDNDNTLLSGETTLKTGQWYHLAGTYEFAGDGSSVMKVFIDDKLDGKLSNAVGPIYIGGADLSIGRLDGAIDEVHVWNTSYASYALKATPLDDINLPGGSCTITANVTPPAPGVKVHFEVLADGNNSGQGAVVNSNSKGLAEWTYSDKALREGKDNIRVWIDRDWSGTFEADKDASVEVRSLWLDNFVTANGNIMDGDSLAWTFGANVGIFDHDVVGEFQLIDHLRQVIYNSNSFNPTNVFFQNKSEVLLDDPLPAGANIVLFGGTFTNNQDSSLTDFAIWMIDAGEPGAKVDRISVKAAKGGLPGTIWIGSLNADWVSPPPLVPYAIPVPISNGNIKAYRTNK